MSRVLDRRSEDWGRPGSSSGGEGFGRAWPRPAADARLSWL